MKSDLLFKAKTYLREGDLVGAAEALSEEIGSMLQATICPGCGASAVILTKHGNEAAECNCGSQWGKRHSGAVGSMLKSDHASGRQEIMSTSKGRPEIETALWALWTRSGGLAVDAWTINQYNATGWISKSLLEKIGFKVPEQPGEALSKTEPTAKTEGTPWGGLSGAQVEMTMLEMFKSNEEPQLVNRHTITKFGTFGSIEADVLRVVLRKAGKDPDALTKATEAKGGDSSSVRRLEDQDGNDPEIAEDAAAVLEANQDPGVRLGNGQQKPKGAMKGLGAAHIERLVHDNPANGELHPEDAQRGDPEKPKKLKGAGDGLDPVAKAALDVSQAAPANPQSLGHHFIFSAENPRHPQTIHATHEQVLHGLRQGTLGRPGMDAREAKGKYGGATERSIIVHNPDHLDVMKLHQLAHGLGQESVLHSDGETHHLNYLHGDNAGKHHEGHGTDWSDHEPEDNYTEIADPATGKRSYFQHNLDFDQLHDHVKSGPGTESVQPEPVVKTGIAPPVGSDPDEVEKSEVADLARAIDRLNKSLAPSPSAAKQNTLMKPKPLATRGVGDGAVDGVGVSLGMGKAMGAGPVKPGAATAPKPGASAKAITTSIKPMSSKAPGMAKAGAVKPPTAGDSKAIEHAQSSANPAHAIGASPAKTGKTFDPASIGISPAGKKIGPAPAKIAPAGIAPIKPLSLPKLGKAETEPEERNQSTRVSMPGDPSHTGPEKKIDAKAGAVLSVKDRIAAFKAKKMKKSEALSAIEAKLAKFSKSAAPSERAQARRLAELYTKISLAKTDEFDPEDVE